MVHNLMLLATIVWIDLLLSGDNAIIISLACRNLPSSQRRIGIGLGAAVAVILRLLLLFAAASILLIPGVRLACGAFLFWVAIKMLPSDEDDSTIPSAPGALLAAIWTVAIADVTMSTDNVAAVAAIAGNNYALLIIGMLISIPFVVIGATLISRLMDAYPWIIVAGSALLAYIAATTMASDSLVNLPPDYTLICGLAFVVLIILLGFRRKLALSK